MSQTLKERDWEILLHRINEGKCTPFLGAGACYGHIPLGAEVARTLAKEHNYPLTDHENLSRVTQFLAVDYEDETYPKDMVVKRWFSNLPLPDYTQKDEPHSVLASLPLPIYITTNYDSFMFQALKNCNKKPSRVVCRWNSLIDAEMSAISEEPSPATPIVFHMHGYSEIPESLVLTEDDYLDFIVNFARNDEQLVPHQIKRALTGTSLLFVGYAVTDSNFRILFRSLVAYLEKSTKKAHMSVQLVPVSEDATIDQIAKAQSYLDRYFGELKIRIFWGTAKEFCIELKQRWEAYKK